MVAVFTIYYQHSGFNRVHEPTNHDRDLYHASLSGKHAAFDTSRLWNCRTRTVILSHSGSQIHSRSQSMLTIITSLKSPATCKVATMVAGSPDDCRCKGFHETFQLHTGGYEKELVTSGRHTSSSIVNYLVCGFYTVTWWLNSCTGNVYAMTMPAIGVHPSWSHLNITASSR